MTRRQENIPEFRLPSIRLWPWRKWPQSWPFFYFRSIYLWCARWPVTRGPIGTFTACAKNSPDFHAPPAISGQRNRSLPSKRFMPPAAKNKRITHSDVLEVEVHPVQLVPVQRIVVRVRHVARIEIESGTGAASFQRREGHRDRNRHLSGCSKLTI